MNSKQKRMLASAILGFCALILALPIKNETARVVIFILGYAAAAWEILFRAIKNVLRGQVFDENFLMAVASIGAIATGEYAEALGVMVFYIVGELFESYAVGRSRRSISELIDIRPEYATVRRGDELVREMPEDVSVGDIITISPGEKIPLDGVVLTGRTTVDTSAITGESVPRNAVPGDDVISGCINISGVIEVKVTKCFEESAVSKILDLVENAASKKAPAENFITKFAKYYTPSVCGAALLLAVLPPLAFNGAWSDWIHRALSFLVISCPCALVISVPLGFFGGIGRASRQGVLIKGSNYMEVLANAKTVAFDKTGTLTEGEFAVRRICVCNRDALGIADKAGAESIDDIADESADKIASRSDDEAEASETMLRLAAKAEAYSSHPIALSLKKASGIGMPEQGVDKVVQTDGRGITAEVDGRTVLVGNAAMMREHSLEPAMSEHIGTIVHVAVDGSYTGYIIISDEIKPTSKGLIRSLGESGIKKTVMLSGDNRGSAEAIAAQLGIDEVYAELLPNEKVEALERLKRENPVGNLVYVGDGVNDAPVIMRADVGVAMGAIGSDAAIEAADVVIMDDDPEKLVYACNISRSTLRIVKENIIFSLSVKAVVMVLGALGIASMWLAVFADVGVLILAILNSMRTMAKK